MTRFCDVCDEHVPFNAGTQVIFLLFRSKGFPLFNQIYVK